MLLRLEQSTCQCHGLTLTKHINTHSSYSEGDHCPLSLSEGPQARTFTAVKGRRPACISLFHSVKGRRPALSLQWRAEGPHSISLFHSVKGRRPTLSLQWRAEGPHSISLFLSVIPQNLFVCLFVCLTDAFRFRCLHAFWKREPKKKNRTKVESEVRSK